MVETQEQSPIIVIRRTKGEGYWQPCVAVLIVALFFTNFINYKYENHFPIPPSMFLYVLYTLTFLFSALHPRTISDMLRSPMVPWALTFLAVAVIWTLGTSQSKDVEQVLRDRTQAVFYALACLVIFQSERAIKTARWSLVLAVLFCVGLNIIDAIHPMTYSEVLGRSAGFFINPNYSGISILMGMVLGIGVLPERWRGAFYLIALVGIALTFSRSAFVGAVIAGVGLMLVGHMSGRSLVAVMAVVGLAFMLLSTSFGSIDALWQQNKFMNENTLRRAGFETDDASTQARLELAKEAYRMFTQSPFVGHGLAASIVWDEDQSSHNIYLNLMVDYGILGALFMPWLAIIVSWKNREALVMAFLIMFWGFYSHNVLEQRALLTCIVLQAVISQRALERQQLLSPNRRRILRSLLAWRGLPVVAGSGKPDGYRAET